MDDAEERLGGHDDKIADLEAAIADGGDFGKRVVTLESEMDTAQSDISDLEETVGAHSTAINTLVGDVTGDDQMSVREIAIDVLTEKLIAEGADASLDTLQEIAAWIQSHPDDAAAMNNAIKAVKLNLGYTNPGETGEVAPETVDTRIANAIAALEISTYAKAADLEKTAGDLSALTTRVGNIENAPYATTANVATAKSEVLGTSTDTSTANTIYGAKKYAEEKADAAKQAAINDAAAKYEEIGVAAGLVNNLVTTGQVKTNTDNIAALQTRTAGALTHVDKDAGMVSNVERDDNGTITVTHRAIKNADLDTSDIFVFYCGDASATGYDSNMSQVTI